MVPKSVEVYKDECKAILSWMSADTWLDQDQFDRLSFEWRWSPRERHVYHYTPETILPPLFGGDLNLAILQELQRSGIVEAREANGRIEYRLADTNGDGK